MKEKLCCGECRWWDFENKVKIGEIPFAICLWVMDRAFPEGLSVKACNKFADEGNTCLCFENRK